MLLNEFSEDGFINKLQLIVEENLDNPDFSIEQLCREAGVSRTQLHRKVKSATDLSTSHFIRKIRLEKARELLEASDDNISEIAYRTGNNSPQNFSKYFIREYGLSPSNYRKQFREQQAMALPTETASEELQFSPPSPPAPNIPAILRIERKPLLFFLVLAGLLLAGWLGRRFLLQTPTTSGEGTVQITPSIAVLPFQHYGPATDEFMSEGIVEDILTYLTQFEDLKVISRTSTAKFKDTEKSIGQIAGELGVSYILEGSVRQDGGEIRITAQLIRAVDDQHIWANRYDRLSSNLMEIQAEVARDIALSLNQSIDPDQKQKLDRVPTKNLDAYNAVLMGRYLQRSRTKTSLYQSIEQFDKALQLDSVYSGAFAGKAAGYYLLAALRYVPDRETDYQRIAEKNALLAIKYDNTNGLAYGILGSIYCAQYRWEEAIAAYEIALGYQPKDAILNYWFSLALRSVGDLDRSLAYNKLASELDPLHPVIHAGYLYTSLLAGKFELAEQIINQVAPIIGESFLYYSSLGNYLTRKGEYEAALEPLEKSLQLNSEFKPAESDKYYCLGRLQRTSAVQTYLATLDTTMALGCLRASKAYISLGNRSQSLHYLVRAADLGVVPEDLLVEPIYAELRDEPDFIKILKRFNFYPYLKDVTVSSPQ